MRYLVAGCLIAMAGGLGAQPSTLGWTRGGFNSAEKILAAPLMVKIGTEARRSIIVPSLDDKLYVYNHDGTQRSGFPKTLGFTDGTMAGAAYGDIDGDGAGEIVVVGDNGSFQNPKVIVYEVDGSLRTSFTISSPTNASLKSTPALINLIKFRSGVAHPALEVVIRDGNGKVHILEWTGSALTDRYPSNTSVLDTCTSSALYDKFGGQLITPSVGAADLPDGKVLLVAPSTDGRVYRWEVASTQGSPFQLTQLTALLSSAPDETRFYGSPAIADLNDDGTFDVVAGDMDGRMYIWNGSNGQLFSGWPITLSQSIASSPALANLAESTSLPEIVFGSDENKVYAYHIDGTLVEGWPQSTRGDVFGSVVCAELDGNEGLEVVASGMDGRVYAWHSDGTPLPGWPMRLNTTAYASPAAGDLHGSGRMAVVAGGYDGQLFVFDLAPWSIDTGAGWQQFMGGPKRQGRY